MAASLGWHITILTLHTSCYSGVLRSQTTGIRNNNAMQLVDTMHTESMRLRRKGGSYDESLPASSLSKPKEQPHAPTNAANDKQMSLRQGLLSLLSSSATSYLGYAFRILFLTIALLLVADIIYIGMERWRFGDPCQVAADAKQRLQEEHGLVDEKSMNLSDGTHGSSSSSSRSPPLPKIIHQQWKDDTIPPGPFTEYHQQWKRLFPEPEYKHMLWTDDTGRQLIAQHYAWFLEAYDNYHMNIQRADAVRYFVLYHYGGLYADLDYEPYTNFWDTLPIDRVTLIESPYKFNEQVQNSLMTSPVRHAFWNCTFDVLYERRQSRQVLSSTGPSAMDIAMARYAVLVTDAAATPTTKQRTTTTTTTASPVVYKLPCENFHRIPLGNAGKNSPLLSRIARTFVAYTPLTKTCGDWTRRDDCQFGIHHNAVSYMSNMGGNLLTILKNF